MFSIIEIKNNCVLITHPIACLMSKLMTKFLGVVLIYFPQQFVSSLANTTHILPGDGEIIYKFQNSNATENKE